MNTFALPGKKTVERNEWIILRSIPSITNIFFYYFPDIAMDNDVEMLDDDHLHLLFADSPPPFEDEPGSPPADAPAPADEPAPEPAPPAAAPSPPPPPPPPPPSPPPARERRRGRRPRSPSPYRRPREPRRRPEQRDRERADRPRRRPRNRSPVERRKYVQSSIYFQLKTDQLTRSTLLSFLQGDVTIVVGKATLDASVTSHGGEHALRPL